MQCSFYCHNLVLHKQFALSELKYGSRILKAASFNTILKNTKRDSHLWRCSLQLALEMTSARHYVFSGGSVSLSTLQQSMSDTSTTSIPQRKETGEFIQVWVHYISWRIVLAGCIMWLGNVILSHNLQCINVTLLKQTSCHFLVCSLPRCVASTSLLALLKHFAFADKVRVCLCFVFAALSSAFYNASDVTALNCSGASDAVFRLPLRTLPFLSLFAQNANVPFNI